MDTIALKEILNPFGLFHILQLVELIWLIAKSWLLLQTWPLHGLEEP